MNPTCDNLTVNNNNTHPRQRLAASGAEMRQSSHAWGEGDRDSDSRIKVNSKKIYGKGTKDNCRNSSSTEDEEGANVTLKNGPRPKSEKIQKSRAKRVKLEQNTTNCNSEQQNSNSSSGSNAEPQEGSNQEASTATEILKQYSMLPNQFLKDPEEGGERGLSASSSDASNFCPTLIKFNSFDECKSEHCRNIENLSHFHCYDLACLDGRALIGKAELVRHLQWHCRKQQQQQKQQPINQQQQKHQEDQTKLTPVGQESKSNTNTNSNTDSDSNSSSSSDESSGHSSAKRTARNVLKRDEKSFYMRCRMLAERGAVLLNTTATANSSSGAAHTQTQSPVVQSRLAKGIPIAAAIGNSSNNTTNNPLQITSIDGFFNRKRGRPPKNRFVEVYKNTQQSPQAIFTSFKLEKQQSGSSTVLCSSRDRDSPGAAYANLLRATEAARTCSSNLPSPKRAELSPTATTTAAATFSCEALSGVQSMRLAEQLASETVTATSTLKETQAVTATAGTLSADGSARIRKSASSVCRSVGGGPSRSAASIELEQDLGAAEAEKIFVVRAAGTFYPQEGVTAADQRLNRSKIATSPSGALGRDDLPQDLRVRREECIEPVPRNSRRLTKSTETGAYSTPVAAAATISLHFKQLLQMYQQQQQQQQPPQTIYSLYPSAAPFPLLSTPGHSSSSGPQTLPLALTTTTASNNVNSGPSSPIPGNLHASPYYEPAAAAAAVAAAAAAAAVANQQNLLNMMLLGGPNQAGPRGSSPPSRPQNLPLLGATRHTPPAGYLKFRFNEDCGYTQCGYRNRQSHFHCNRRDCHYSFCDKTRFVQHTARHERLDTLMGEDFQQYRANMPCGYANCVYDRQAAESSPSPSAKKSSHYHCLRCDFICVDTNKVVAHRRLHSKMEYIRRAGFRKVPSSEKCGGRDTTTAEEACAYSRKHTHYHCLVCDCSVLSRTQLTTHRHKTPATATVTMTTTSTAMATAEETTPSED